MELYYYRYITEAKFSPDVGWHFFKLRAIPCSNAFQKNVEPSLAVWMEDEERLLRRCGFQTNKDGYGNEVQWGSISDSHRLFRFVSEGCVVQSEAYRLTEIPAPYYCASTRLTQYTDEMGRFASQYDDVISLMHAVHGLVEYTACSTTVSTTAIEVWNERRGVCQDYAHLMIALCRSKGWYARYVNGFIPGEGQTHAWVEVSDGKAWYGYDPTLDKAIAWGYVKIAHGRDADDCPTNRGRIYGWTTETMSVQASLVIGNR